MKEVTFIRRNIEKWKETEKVVERAASLYPDQLADAYTDLTADLAFAQTHFPTSRITIYLNNPGHSLLIIRRLMRWQQKSKRRSIIRDVHRACFVALPVSKR